MSTTLYICYFGMREPLVQTQVLPYLRELGKGEKGLEREKGKRFNTENEELVSIFPMGVSLLTFEPSGGAEDVAEFAAIREKLSAEGIQWEWLPYHRRFSALATAWDILRGAIRVWRMNRRLAFDVLHCRVHVPALMAVAARKLMRRKPKILFDIRGFFPEEYVDAGIWPENGAIFSTAKRVERWLMKESDGFVVLTEKAREILFRESAATGVDESGRPVEVIPCCVDFGRRFSGEPVVERARVREELGLKDRQVIVHAGALGGLYLSEEIADLMVAARLRRPDVFCLFVTQSDPRIIEPLLIERGFSKDDYYIGRVMPNDMEGYLYASDIGLSIVKATFATQSRSPTKIPEYLACGLPIIANAGVGDVDKLITENGVGALLTEFSPEGYSQALTAIEQLGDVGDTCRETAAREFDLERVGGRKYRSIYSRLLNGEL
jgi:glycosyltransferase involved in cell wall biosynthesis